MKTVITILFFVSVSFVNANVLTNIVLDIANLNGTNGIAFYNSNTPSLWGLELSFVEGNKSNDFLIRGISNVTYFSSLFNTNQFDVICLNGTNGFQTLEWMKDFSGHKPESWTNVNCWLGISGILSNNYQPLHFLTPNIVMPANVSLTDSFWAITKRIYLTNMLPLASPCRVGNFIYDSPNSIAYQPVEKGVVVIPFNTFPTNNASFEFPNTNSVYLNCNGGGQINNILNANNDKYDDLLIGSFEEECWLVFGGKNLTGEVNLTEIGTSGVRFHTIFSEHPGMGIKPNAGGLIGDMGDINDDGLSDFAYSDYGYVWEINNSDQYIAVLFGRTNWSQNYYANDLNGLNGFKIKKDFDWIVNFSGKGDVNGDGHEDIILLTNGENQDIYILYGGPFIKPIMQIESEITGINGFRISVYHDFTFSGWHKADINGDANGDGFDDILFAIGASSRPTNYTWLVYGGQSPSAPPALRTPLWINVGESNSLTFELTDVPTNIVWTGCKKGDDYTFCYTNGVRCPAWDIPMGKLWFTNSYTITSTDDFLTVSYTSTNALGPAAGFTTLTIEPIPEPITTGIVFLTTALIGKAFSNK